MDKDEVEVRAQGQSVTFVGQAGVSIYMAITLKHACMLWHRAKMKTHRDLGPKRLLEKVREITGRRFGLKQFPEAIDALEVWIGEHGAY